ncbi:glycosyltransferase family 2 protein [Candidatus Falkowbacteria bacterium]|nr:MAG: glycosyltransferase family 2 protein [Candidatus Falkowbacteria bacterium]
MSLSVIVPIFNESKTILDVIEAVKNCHIENAYLKEIIVIDDASTDGTIAILQNYTDPVVRYIYKDKNQGKGSSLQIGFMQAQGDIIIIQDGDLEYNPSDFQVLLNPILQNTADVVYGSRFIIKRKWGKKMYMWRFANYLLTILSNIFTGLSLTDMETCYKVFNRQTVEAFKGKLLSNRFEIEPELTAWVAFLKVRVSEVPISYIARSREHGKKIGWKDGFQATFAIIYFYFRIKLM